MRNGSADQHSSSSSSSQMSESHISKRLVESTNNTVEYMKSTPVDRVEMTEDSSSVGNLVEVNVEVAADQHSSN